MESTSVMFFLPSLLFLTIGTVLHVSASVCKGEQRFEADIEILDHVIAGPLILTFATLGEHQCEVACKMRANCGAINIGPNEVDNQYLTCELLDKKFDTITVEKKKGWRFMATKCGKACENNGKCFSLKAGHTSCVCLTGKGSPSCDACPAGWHHYKFGKSCYYVSPDEMNWEQAVQRCRSLGAQLVTINNQDENAYIRGLTTAVYFIGLNDRDTEGQFIWEDGTPLTYEHWFAGEPNHGDCVIMVSSGYWRDRSCNRTRKYVCKAAVQYY